MYRDNAPCSVCGSPVELRAREVDDGAAPDRPVGDPAGYVGDGDSTPDERVCTNPRCPSHASPPGP